jgi:hypothetical protein
MFPRSTTETSLAGMTVALAKLAKRAPAEAKKDVVTLIIKYSKE